MLERSSTHPGDIQAEVTLEVFFQPDAAALTSASRRSVNGLTYLPEVL